MWFEFIFKYKMEMKYKKKTWRAECQQEDSYKTCKSFFFNHSLVAVGIHNVYMALWHTLMRR